MNVLVVGTGSIGRRHAANLVELGANVSTYSHRGEPAAVVPGVQRQVVGDLGELLDSDFDAVIVANRTDQHLAVALQAANRGKALFIEKPLSLSLRSCDELQRAVSDRCLVVEAGFMLRFHPNLAWIKRFLADDGLGELMHIRASVGQWLPDWRPGTDYRSGYGAFRHAGGGVIFDLIHELDLVGWLGGTVAEVSAMTRYVDCLDIETEAIAQIGLRLASGALAQVHLDYVRPGYGRILEIVGAQGVVSWDYQAGTVSLSGADGAVEVVHRVPDAFVRNDMFRDHMAWFLRRLSEPGLPPSSSLEDGIRAMQVALACHRSASERRHVRPDEIDPVFEPKEKRR